MQSSSTTPSHINTSTPTPLSSSITLYVCDSRLLAILRANNPVQNVMPCAHDSCAHVLSTSDVKSDETALTILNDSQQPITISSSSSSSLSSSSSSSSSAPLTPPSMSPLPKPTSSSIVTSRHASLYMSTAPKESGSTTPAKTGYVTHVSVTDNVVQHDVMQRDTLSSSAQNCASKEQWHSIPDNTRTPDEKENADMNRRDTMNDMGTLVCLTPVQSVSCGRTARRDVGKIYGDGDGLEYDDEVNESREDHMRMEGEMESVVAVRRSARQKMARGEVVLGGWNERDNLLHRLEL